jgi:hypothetical protein
MIEAFKDEMDPCAMSKKVVVCLKKAADGIMETFTSNAARKHSSEEKLWLQIFGCII